jgi:hypothetical protein
MQRSMIGLITVGLFLQGCSSWPYMKEVQEAQRVDPVVVQWARKSTTTDGKDCRTPPTLRGPAAKPGEGGAQPAQKPVTDVLCPIDLDTWAFPHDQIANDQGKRTIPAYAKVTACFEQYVEPGNLKEVQETLESLKQQQTANNKAIADLTADTGSQQTLKKAAETAREAEQKKLDAEKAKASDKQDAKVVADTTKAIDDLNKQVAAMDKKISENAAAIEERTKTGKLQLEYHILHYSNIANALQATQKAGGAPRPRLDAPFPLPADTVVCRAMRNLLQDEIIARSEEMCRKHISDVGATNSVINADLGLTTLIGSTLGAVVTGDVLQRTFSAVASVSAGTQSLISREIYRDYVAPAISKAIIAERDKKLIEIRLEQAKNLADYTPARAIRDTIDYHESCSFSHGLILLTTSAEKRALPSQDQVRKQIDDLYEQLTKLENSKKTADGRTITTQEEDQLQKTRLKLRRQIDALQERLRLIQSL